MAASPFPWAVRAKGSRLCPSVVAADGTPVASCQGQPVRAKLNAEMIVAAGNAYGPLLLSLDVLLRNFAPMRHEDDPGRQWVCQCCHASAPTSAGIVHDARCNWAVGEERLRIARQS